MPGLRFLCATGPDDDTEMQDNGKLRVVKPSDNYEEIERMLKSGSNPNEADHWGTTPLGLAAANGWPKICALLIANGANVKNEGSVNAVCRAAAHGQVETLEVLLSNLECGKPIRSKPENMAEPEAEDTDLQDIDTREKVGNCTALAVACSCGEGATVSVLMKNGANPYLHVGDGLTAADCSQGNRATMGAVVRICPAYNRVYQHKEILERINKKKIGWLIKFSGGKENSNSVGNKRGKWQQRIFRITTKGRYAGRFVWAEQEADLMQALEVPTFSNHCLLRNATVEKDDTDGDSKFFTFKFNEVDDEGNLKRCLSVKADGEEDRAIWMRCLEASIAQFSGGEEPEIVREADLVERVDFCFNVADQDNSGAIERGEFNELAAMLMTKPLTEVQSQTAFQDMDEEGTGSINKEDFSDWFFKQGDRIKKAAATSVAEWTVKDKMTMLYDCESELRRADAGDWVIEQLRDHKTNMVSYCQEMNFKKMEQGESDRYRSEAQIMKKCIGRGLVSGAVFMTKDTLYVILDQPKPKKGKSAPPQLKLVGMLEDRMGDAKVTNGRWNALQDLMNTPV